MGDDEANSFCVDMLGGRVRVRAGMGATRGSGGWRGESKYPIHRLELVFFAELLTPPKKKKEENIRPHIMIMQIIGDGACEECIALKMASFTF